MAKWVFFGESEVVGLNHELVAMLDMARKYAGVPFIIKCGLRTPERNAQVDGVEDSAHITGLAVDIAVSDSDRRFKIVSGALQAGFKRIGVYDRSLHLDIDKSKPQNVIWWGVSK